MNMEWIWNEVEINFWDLGTFTSAKTKNELPTCIIKIDLCYSCNTTILTTKYTHRLELIKRTKISAYETKIIDLKMMLKRWSRLFCLDLLLSSVIKLAQKGWIGLEGLQISLKRTRSISKPKNLNHWLFNIILKPKMVISRAHRGT